MGNAKKVAVMMSFLMGATMSLALSFVGNMLSGHFTIMSFLISFVISFIISIIIGLCVPIHKISEYFRIKMNIKHRTINERFLNALISDIIYTPIITLIMVFVMVGGANRMLDSRIADNEKKMQENEFKIEQLTLNVDNASDVEDQINMLIGENIGLQKENDGMNKGRPSIAKEFFVSSIVCFVIGYIIISVIEPIFVRFIIGMLHKKE